MLWPASFVFDRLRPLPRYGARTDRYPCEPNITATLPPLTGRVARGPIAAARADAERRERALGARAEEAARIAEHRHQLGDEALVVGCVVGDDRSDLVMAGAQAVDEDVVALGAIQLRERTHERDQVARGVVVFVRRRRRLGEEARGGLGERSHRRSMSALGEARGDVVPEDPERIAKRLVERDEPAARLERVERRRRSSDAWPERGHPTRRTRPRRRGARDDRRA